MEWLTKKRNSSENLFSAEKSTPKVRILRGVEFSVVFLEEVAIQCRRLLRGSSETDFANIDCSSKSSKIGSPRSHDNLIKHILILVVRYLLWKNWQGIS
jgi:hypothetical protein